ncbi:ABC transporter permease subunit [Planomonospora algeriensis]
MSSGILTSARLRLPGRLRSAYIPVLATAGLLAAMFVAGGVRYEGFASGQVVLNVFIDNAFLLVVAVGMTFVILTGGIDLSVGAVVALSTMLSASLMTDGGWPPLLVVPLVLLIGSVLGLAMGCIIHYFDIQPFIVTLAGMFLARGLCYVIGTDSISITDPAYTAVAQARIELPAGCPSR